MGNNTWTLALPLPFLCYPGSVPRILTCAALCLALTGCHLIFQYEDREVSADAAAGDAEPAGDQITWAELSTQDLGRSDTGGFYIKELFKGGMGAVRAGAGCTWKVFDGLLHQTSTANNGCHATAAVPANDYYAETLVQIHAIKGIASWTEGAGLGVRVQTSGYKPPAPPAMYVCAVSPDANQLVLARCPGGGTNDCTILDSRTASIALGSPYRIRVGAVGSVITCYLPDQNKSILFPILDMLNGGVALVTFYSRASFDYLAAWP